MKNMICLRKISSWIKVLASDNFTERRNSITEKNPLQTPAIEFIFSKTVGFTLRKMQKFQLIIWREDFP